jgi:pheromone a factor receptor
MPFLPSWVSLVIISIPPILLELIAGVYGCLSIHAFYNRSKQNGTHNYLDSNRYIRLISFSACDLICGIPITLFYLYLNTTVLVPFPGLTEEHYHFSNIVQVPAVVWRATTLSELGTELNRWILVWGAFVFFAIFGFTEESRNNYRSMLQSVVQVFVKKSGIKKSGIESSIGSSATECVASFFFLSVLRLIYSNMIFRIKLYNSYGSSRY